LSTIPKFLSAIVSFSVLLALSGFSVAQDIHRVDRVIDGDTIVLDDDERVRLIGVDSPETVHPSRPVEHYGKEASAFTRNLLEGKIVRLEYDQQRRDKYDRILAYVFIDDLFVNAELIEKGYAHAYTRYPFRQEYMDLFVSLEREAREGQHGLWGPPQDSVLQLNPNRFWLNTDSNVLHNSKCRWYEATNQGRFTNGESGSDCGICSGRAREDLSGDGQRQESSEVTVYVAKSGKKYHRGNCRHLRKSKIAMNLSEARTRYGACKNCKPPG